jgi:hypothetical protein
VAPLPHPWRVQVSHQTPMQGSAPEPPLEPEQERASVPDGITLSDSWDQPRDLSVGYFFFQRLNIPLC